MSDAMQAIVQDRYGSPDVLSVEQVPVPRPEPDEVLVHVEASTVSTAQMALRRGRPVVARLVTGWRRPKEPIPGSELAGEVVSIGAAVSGISVGERVVGATGSGFGGHAEFARVPGAAIAPIPEGVESADAVAMAEGGLTALPFLRDTAGLHAGQRIVINGAAGAVGSAAVQLAKHLGAEVTAVCSAGRADLVRSLGADRIIDYAQEDFTHTDQPYDVVFDAVGRSSFGRARQALRDGGIYMTTVIGARIVPQMLWTSKVGSRRAAIAFTGLRTPADKGQDLRTLMELAASGSFRAVIDRSFTLADSVAAHRYVEQGRKHGAVVLTV